MNRIKAKNSENFRQFLREKNKTKKENKEEYVNSTNFDLYIGKSNIEHAGLGVFTNDYIFEDTIIGEYNGELIENFEPNIGDYYYEIVEPDKEKGIIGVGIDALKFPRDYMAMINDASFEKVLKNNCEFQTDVENKKVYIVAIKDIQPEEELFVSYGEGYWNISNKALDKPSENILNK